MIKLDRPVIVEGKYDMIKLSNILDALIIKTDGFGIFKNDERAALIRRLAEKNGVIVLTDSDASGMTIRNYIKKYPPRRQDNKSLYARSLRQGEAQKSTLQGRSSRS